MSAEGADALARRVLDRELERVQGEIHAREAAIVALREELGALALMRASIEADE